MMKLIFAQAGLIKGEIIASLFLAGLICFGGLITGLLLSGWIVIALLLGVLLCRGFHVVLGQSVSGDESILMQTLPVAPPRMMLSRGILCGLWASVILMEVVMVAAVLCRYEPYYELVVVEHMTLWLMARGMSRLEAAFSMGLLPVWFFVLGWFVGSGILAAQLRWGAAFEKRRCGILLTVISMVLLSAAVFGIGWIGDRAAGVSSWSFGCYLASEALLAGIGWLFQRGSVGLLETRYDNV